MSFATLAFAAGFVLAILFELWGIDLDPEEDRYVAPAIC